MGLTINLLRYMPKSMLDFLRKRFQMEKIKKFSAKTSSVYNQSAPFKQKVHKILEIFNNPNSLLNGVRIEFSCKSLVPNQLPPIDQDSMNSQGNAKIQDVADYIFYEDGLYKCVAGAPNPA